MANVPEAAKAMEIAIEDETHFIDFMRSSIFIGKEHVFIDRRETIGVYLMTRRVASHRAQRSTVTSCPARTSNSVVLSTIHL